MTKVGEYYSIREFYYLDKKHPHKVTAWTVEPSSPVGDTIKELEADFKLMAQALKQPVIDVGKTEDAPATLKAKETKARKK